MARARKQEKAAVGRPVGSDREANTARILQAALECFAERGYAATTFKEIAARVGFTHGALYQYYDNKVELYRALIKSIQVEHRQAIEAIVAGEADFKTQLKQIFAVFVEDHMGNYNRSMFLASASVETKRHPELASAEEEDLLILVMLQDFFRRHIEAGDINPAFQPDDLMLAFLGSLMGMSLMQHSTGIGEVDRAFAILLAMLEGEFQGSAAQ